MVIRKLGRKKQNREHLIANLATDLILYQEISSTVAKLKSVQPYIEKIMTLVKKDSLSSRRLVKKMVNNNKAIAKLYDIGLNNIKNDKNGGYTSIIKTISRRGDGALLAKIVIKSDVFKIELPKTDVEKDKVTK